ncbi:hypothetical protein ACFX13_009128 [Malus domestica]
MDPPPPEAVYYICGDCGMEVQLKSNDVIQCRECGYRILYKKRTRRIICYIYSLFFLLCLNDIAMLYYLPAQLFSMRHAEKPAQSSSVDDMKGRVSHVKYLHG